MATPGESNTGISAPYGQACANCAKAKTRCIPRPAGNCERCHRLDKDCLPSVTVRKRSNVKPPASSKRARLEERLDDLVTLLQSQRSRPDALTNPEPDSTPEGEHPWIPPIWKTGRPKQNIANPCKAHETVNIRDPGSTNPFLEQITLTPTTPAYSTPESAIASATLNELPQIAAEKLLNHFRSSHMKNTPFFYIPATTTAHQLQRSRPFLWLVIRAICTKSMAEQQELGASIREILSKQVYVEFERNIDLLLGLLAYLGWSTHFARGRPYMCVMSSLASSMVFDLRLDRKTRDDITSAPTNCFKPYAFPKPPASANPRARTNEERRALLGTFFTTSIVCCYMRFESARWKPNLEEALQYLWEAPETPLDRILVAMIRLMMVVDDAARLVIRVDDTDPSPPSMFHIKALLGSLDQVKKTFESDVLENIYVRAHMHSTEVAIYELAMFHPSSSSAFKSTDYKRREYLQAGLESAKAFLECFLAIDAADYPGLSFWLMIEYAHSAQVLYRLCLLDDPGWDRSLARQSADIIYYLEQTVLKMEKAHEIGDYSVNGDDGSLFTKAAAALKVTIPLWTTTLEQVGAVTTAQGQGMSDTVNAQVDPMLMDFTDDTWLTDMFASWENN